VSDATISVGGGGGFWGGGGGGVVGGKRFPLPQSDHSEKLTPLRRKRSCQQKKSQSGKTERTNGKEERGRRRQRRRKEKAPLSLTFPCSGRSTTTPTAATCVQADVTNEKARGEGIADEEKTLARKGKNLRGKNAGGGIAWEGSGPEWHDNSDIFAIIKKKGPGKTSRRLLKAAAL